MKILVNQISEIPVFDSEAQQDEFWSTHWLSDELIKSDKTQESFNVSVGERNIEIIICNIPKLLLVVESGITVSEISEDTRQELEEMKSEIEKISKKVSKSLHSEFTIDFSKRKVVERSL